MRGWFAKSCYVSVLELGTKQQNSFHIFVKSSLCLAQLSARFSQQRVHPAPTSLFIQIIDTFGSSSLTWFYQISYQDYITYIFLLLRHSRSSHAVIQSVLAYAQPMQHIVTLEFSGSENVHVHKTGSQLLNILAFCRYDPSNKTPHMDKQDPGCASGYRDTHLLTRLQHSNLDELQLARCPRRRRSDICVTRYH